MRFEISDSFSAVPADEWNALNAQDDPFLSHEFLVALERNGCVGRELGWITQVFLLRDDQERLVGAAPGYIKTNSYGEFVFDWAWADAYQQHGLAYYPKLVVAIPYTPATGQRLLVAPDADFDAVAGQLQAQVLDHCRRRRLSGLHWLFTTDRETALLDDAGLLRRMGCQYIWRNRDYRDFDDFLDGFASRKRKKVRRERRRVDEQGLTLVTRHGDEMSEADWQVVHDFYLATYERKWGVPTLTREFFTEVGRTMGRRVITVMAYERTRPVSASVMFRSRDTLYGRVWGCRAHFHSLHFEACYYRGIDYCIEHRLSRFEPGAQGEHKIARGFRPTPTWSAHWLAEPAFHDAIRRYLAEERPAIEAQCAELHTLLPFRREHG